MEYYLQLIINGLVVGSIYSLVALGFVIIFKATKVVNFAQGDEMIKKGSIMGALALYLDFINLFLSLLSFFGGSRD